MSSIVSVRGSQGYVISSDSIVFKYVTDPTGRVNGKIKGITRKLFQIHNDIVVVGLGNWNSYFPMFNQVARMSAPKDNMVNELRSRAAELTDARIYIFSTSDNDVTCDIVENKQIRLNQIGAIMYPEPMLNSMFWHGSF